MFQEFTYEEINEILNCEDKKTITFTCCINQQTYILNIITKANAVMKIIGELKDEGFIIGMVPGDNEIIMMPIQSCLITIK